MVQIALNRSARVVSPTPARFMSRGDRPPVDANQRRDHIVLNVGGGTDAVVSAPDDGSALDQLATQTSPGVEEANPPATDAEEPSSWGMEEAKASIGDAEESPSGGVEEAKGTDRPPTLPPAAYN